MSITLMKTILVVEDTPSEMKLISYYLQESGYSVINAISAKEALERILEKKPDIIITDVVMPEMSGFELCRNLKKHPETEKLPVIICTSKNQEIDRLWAMRQGANAYITKPFTREELLKVVQSIMTE
ncbi:MAG: response regulator [Cyanobacteria bacterium J069]|nr:MAG: response regulator [Cyanobacteria bacterium J069]